MRVESANIEPIESSIEYAVVCLANQITLQNYLKHKQIDLGLDEEPYSDAKTILDAAAVLLARSDGNIKRTASYLKAGGVTGRRLAIMTAACAVLSKRVVVKTPEGKLPIELLMVCFETVAVAEVAEKFDLSKVPPFIVEELLVEHYGKMVEACSAQSLAKGKLDG